MALVYRIAALDSAFVTIWGFGLGYGIDTTAYWKHFDTPAYTRR